MIGLFKLRDRRRWHKYDSMKTAVSIAKAQTTLSALVKRVEKVGDDHSDAAELRRRASSDL